MLMAQLHTRLLHWVFMIKLSIQRTQLEDLRAKHCALDPDLAEVVRQEQSFST